MTVAAAQPATPVYTYAEWHAIVNDPTDRTYRHLTGIGPDVAPFLAWYEHEKGRSATTAEKYEHVLRRFAWYLGDTPLEHVTKDDCRAFLATLVDDEGRVYPRARGNAWSALRVFFRFWYREERLAKNPMEYVDAPPSRRRLPKDLFEPEEIARIARTASGRPYLRDLVGVLLLFYAGLRGGELRALRVGDVDLRARRVLVRHGKGDKDRVIPFSEGGELHNALTSFTLTPVDRLGKTDRPSPRVRTRALAETDHVFFRTRANATGPCAWPSQECSDSSFNLWWHTLLDEAGVEYRVPHTARHTFGTRAAEVKSSVADAKTLQRLLGHASVQITLDLYVHPTERDAGEMIDRLEQAMREAMRDTQ